MRCAMRCATQVRGAVHDAAHALQRRLHLGHARLVLLLPRTLRVELVLRAAVGGDRLELAPDLVLQLLVLLVFLFV